MTAALTLTCAQPTASPLSLSAFADGASEPLHSPEVALQRAAHGADTGARQTRVLNTPDVGQFLVTPLDDGFHVQRGLGGPGLEVAHLGSTVMLVAAQR